LKIHARVGLANRAGDQLPVLGSLRLGSPVIDRTETAGNYDFSVDISPDDIHPGGADPNSLSGPGVSLFDSIRKIGLKLKSQKIPLDVIVVAHAEKIPTEN
jgi:uncharacterized protein (TIGR03435 family)